jgi:hypothetical protein
MRQYANNVANNSRVHTSTYTPIMSICTHHLGNVGGKKTDCKTSLLRETFEGTNTTFLFSFSFSIYLMQYADLSHPEMRDLCELVGTLNVWVTINTPIDQSHRYFRTVYTHTNTHIEHAQYETGREKKRRMSLPYVCIHDTYIHTHIYIEYYRNIYGCILVYIHRERANSEGGNKTKEYVPCLCMYIYTYTYISYSI